MDTAALRKELEEGPERSLSAGVAEVREVVMRAAALLDGLLSEFEGAPNADQARDAVASRPERLKTLDRSLLRTWLADRGITLVQVRSVTPRDAVLDRVARSLGSQYQPLSDLLRALRWSVSSARPANLSLRDSPADTISAVTGACARLHELGLLGYYRYDRNGRTVAARPSETAGSFLTGEWLERWVAQRMQAAASAAGVEPLVERNVERRLPDGGQTELDLLAAIGDQPLWVECRTGAYQDRLSRYAQLRRQLGLHPSRALIVLADVADDTAAELSVIHELRIASVSTLDRELGELLAASEQGAPGLGGAPEPLGDLAPAPVYGAVEPEAAAAPEDGAPPAPPPQSTEPGGQHLPARADDRLSDRHRAVLRRAGLRPHPERRDMALRAVRDALEEGPPASFRDLKATIAEAAGLSLSAANDILWALLRGGGLLRADGSPAATADEIARLATRDLEGLEQLCLSAYRTALRAADPTSVEGPQAERAFLATVIAGGTPAWESAGDIPADGGQQPVTGPELENGRLACEPRPRSV